MIEGFVTFELIAQNFVMSALGNVLSVDCENPSINEFEWQAHHFSLLSIGSNHHPEGDSWGKNFMVLELEMLGLISYADSVADRFDGDEDAAAFVGDGGDFDAVDDRDELLLHSVGILYC